jgi:hypothetical protein
MPLPSSGTIKISQIRSELGTSSGSLRYLSSLAGFSTPDRMSDFYGYAPGGTYTVINYDYSYAFCSQTVGYKNGSYYLGATGTGNSQAGTINTGDTFYGSTSSDCYGSVSLDVYSDTRGYLYSNGSGIAFGAFLSSGTYTRQSGENITITGYFYEASPPCLVAGTLITLADGSQVPVETLSEGVELQSTLIDTLENTNDASVLIMWTSNELVESRTTSKIAQFQPEQSPATVIINGGLLEASPTHLQVVKVKGVWRVIRMTHVGVGDMLYDINGNLIEVTSVDISMEPKTVYRLTLSETSHTYFANGILTHNIKGPGFE